jgi:hypothetical protein
MVAAMVILERGCMKKVLDEVKLLGPHHAAEIGRSQYTAVAEDGSRSPGTDDDEVVWRRGDDGAWRYLTDMFDAR